MLKLGQFAEKSYITYKEPGAEKFTLLVSCSSMLAARNGFHHHVVMAMIWASVIKAGKIPSKQFCKQQILDILNKKM